MSSSKQPVTYLWTGLCVWGGYVLVHQGLLMPDMDPANKFQNLVWLIKSLIFGSLPASLFLIGLMFFFPKTERFSRLARGGMAVTVTVYFSALLAISIYFRYFGDLPYPQMLVERWRETWSIRYQVIGQLLQGREIALLLLWTICLVNVAVADRSRRSFPVSIFWTFVFLSLAFNCSFVVYKGLSGDLQEDVRFGHTNVAQARGIGFAYGVMLLEGGLAGQGQTPPTPFPGKVNAEPDKESLTSLPRNTNIIILQVESLDPDVLDRQVGGRAITPFLNQLKSHSVFFNNFIAQHSGGGTSDCELSVLTSLLPSRKGVGFQTARYDLIHSLPTALKENNYTCAVYHPNYASYFYRSLGFPKLGFDYYFHESHFEGRARGMFAGDKPFLEQCVSKIKLLRRPFYAHVITIQSHGPFSNTTDVSFRDFLKKHQPEAERIVLDYLTVIHEADQAIERFFHLLKQQYLMDNTLIVLFSDHLSSVLSRRKDYEQIPLMLIHPQLPAARVAVPGSHLDIAPTITALLNVQEPQGWLGTTLLPPDPHRVVLINGPVRIFLNQGALELIQSADDLIYYDYSNYLLGR